MKPWIVATWIVAVFVLAACGGAQATPYPEPTAYPTYTPYPEPTAYPTYTPYPEPVSAPDDLDDLFCSYDFCMGHPSGAYLTDLEAPDEWNFYDIGSLVGISTSGTWIGVDWEQISLSKWQLDEQVADLANSMGEAQGEVHAEQAGGFELAVVSIYDAEDPDLPYGTAAAWYCGDRGFRAAVFTKKQSPSEVLLLESIERFFCSD
ncbi:MAG: hypothetical protein ABTQ73_03420 [Caldilineales bacterium]